jgi:hypothetical protein
MFRDFYATVAQVMPVLLLALMWDSGFLHRLRDQPRLARRIDPDGVRFWTKPRVRVYSLFVATVIVAATVAALLVLGGLLADSHTLRVCVSASVALALSTLLFRLAVDIVLATRTDNTTPPG